VDSSEGIQPPTVRGAQGKEGQQLLRMFSPRTIDSSLSVEIPANVRGRAGAPTPLQAAARSKGRKGDVNMKADFASRAVRSVILVYRLSRKRRINVEIAFDARQWVSLEVAVATPPNQDVVRQGAGEMGC